MRYQSKNSRKATKRKAQRNAFRAWFLRDLCKFAAVPPALVGLKPRRIPAVIIDEVSDVPTLAASALEAWTKCPRKIGFSQVFAAPYGQRQDADLLVYGNAYAELARVTKVDGFELPPDMAQRLRARLTAAIGLPLTDLVIDSLTQSIVDELQIKPVGQSTTEVAATPPPPPTKTDKYYLGHCVGDKYVESEVSRADFCRAERANGFRPRAWPGRVIDDLTLATGGFGSGGIRGRIVVNTELADAPAVQE